MPRNSDAVAVFEEQRGKHAQYCFTYSGQPIRWELSNTAWRKAWERTGLEDFRFHHLRHAWASFHRQAGASCDELKDLGSWKSRAMVDRCAKFSTDNLADAAARVPSQVGGNVLPVARLRHGRGKKAQ